MSFFTCLVDLVLVSIIMLDTLGLVNQLRKTVQCDTKDYTRVCFTWIFFLFVSALTNCSCTGFFAKVFGFLGFLLRVYVSIPLLGGTLKIYHFLIEENKALEYGKKLVDMVKSSTGMSCAQPASEVKTE